MLSWSGRRQLIYLSAVVVLGLVLMAGVWKALFSEPPTCFDGSRNGDERGVDCGGTCTLICSQDAQAPIVRWARSFEVAPGFYNTVAYVENKNVGAYVRNVKYSFKLFDGRGILVKEQTGVLDIPPVPALAIVEAVNVGNREVADVDFIFGNEPLYWMRASEELPTVRLSQQNLATDGSRLSTLLTNDSVRDLYNLTATAILYDEEGIARATSKSTTPLLARRSSREVVFTWPKGTPDVQTYQILILPPF